MTEHRAAPSGPVQKSLTKTLLDRFQRLCEVGKCMMDFNKAVRLSVPNPPGFIAESEFEEIKELVEQSKGLLEETLELWGWVAPESTRKPTEADVREAVRFLTEKKIGAGLVAELVKKGARGFSGRPATKRRAAIRALELRLEDKKAWPWRKVVRELCDCTKPEHDHYCEESLKAEVRRLGRLLRKYGIEVRHVKFQDAQT